VLSGGALDRIEGICAGAGLDGPMVWKPGAVCAAALPTRIAKVARLDTATTPIVHLKNLIMPHLCE
jgi:hypothetical protein